MLDERFLLYFGCWDRAGHFLYDRNGNRPQNLPRSAIPETEMDGSKVFLPQPEKVGTGKLTHVISGGLCTTVLAWWGSPFDSRGAVCAVIQCDGWCTGEDLWTRFALVYKDLAPKLTKPTWGAA